MLDIYFLLMNHNLRKLRFRILKKITNNVGYMFDVYISNQDCIENTKVITQKLVLSLENYML